MFYQAEALVWVGTTTTDDGERNASRALLGQSLDLRRAIGDRNGIAWITLNLTEVMLLQLDYGACERYAREALALMREIGSLKGVLQAMFKLAQMAMVKGDLEEARTLVEQIRHQADETNSLDGNMLSLGLLAFLSCVMDEQYAEGAALAQQQHLMSLEPFFDGHNDLGARWGQVVANCGLGQYTAARRGYAALFWERYDDPGPATVCLALEAAARAHDGALEAAAELLGLAFHQPAWAGGWLHRWPLLARLRADLIRQLDAEVYRAAWERGRGHDLETIIRSVLGEQGQMPQSTAGQSLLEPLSERELEVLGLIAAGLSNRDIAERLVLAVGTVKVHTRNIYGKLNVNSRTQAVAQAAKFNLL
jgi:DNA-binding CsgD family transcriptional regulator